MKNKIVTMICVAAILVTTAFVALANTNEQQKISAYSEGEQRPLIDQRMQCFGDNGQLIDAPNDQELLPMTEALSMIEKPVNGRECYFAVNSNVRDRIVTVENISVDTPVYLRTVIAFEAGDLSIAEFQESLYINLKETYEADNVQAWSYPEITKWIPLEYQQKKYYMLVATYKSMLAPNNITEPNLLQVGLKSGVSNDVVKKFGDTYEIMVRTQAVSADVGVDASTALETAFGEITSTNHPWKDTSTMPETNTSAADDNNN